MNRDVRTKKTRRVNVGRRMREKERFGYGTSEGAGEVRVAVEGSSPLV